MFDEIPVCVAYEIDGQRVDEIPANQPTSTTPCPSTRPCPVGGIGGARELDDLPPAARSYVAFLEEQSGCRISAIGIGQDRNATISLRDLID